MNEASDLRRRMNPAFRAVEGGLFSRVTKADVGDTVQALLDAGGANLAWADPFAPDPSLPEPVMQAMLQALAGGKISHYVMPIGDPALRELIAKNLTQRDGVPVDPGRNVVICPGSDSGLLFAMMPFIEPGDEVLIPDPSYPSNFLNAKLLGGVSVPVPLREEDGYQLRYEDLAARLTSRTKMVLITHPNNPTTTVFRRESIEALCRFVVENDLILVSDQAFEDHIFDGIEFVSPCLLPGMWERTVTVRSISKGYGLSGLRIGYLVADDHIMDVMYGAAVNVMGAPNTLASIGACAALSDPTILPDYSARLLRRRDLAYSILSAAPGVQMRPSESGILSWLNIERLGTDAEVADWLLERCKIMVNRGSGYGARGAGHLRIVSACFWNDEDAKLRFERIRDALAELAEKKRLAT